MSRFYYFYLFIFDWKHVGFDSSCRFVELSAVLEPGRPPKSDKPAILDDAIRVLTQLRAEAQELKETNEKLLEEVKSLKVHHFLAHLLKVFLFSFK